MARKIEEENKIKEAQEIKQEKTSEEEDDLTEAAELKELEDRAVAMGQAMEGMKNTCIYMYIHVHMCHGLKK